MGITNVRCVSEAGTEFVNNETKMILLFGMPRSGTTWIGKIFDSHPDTLYMHEPDSWQRLNDIPLFIEDDYSDSGNSLDAFVLELRNMTKAQVTSKLPIFKKNYQSAFHFQAYKSSLYYSFICHKLGISKNIDPIRRASAGKNDAMCIVWKSIESLGRLAFFSKHIKNVTCSHIVRNPAGHIFSVMTGESKKTFQSSTPSSEDYHLFELLLASDRGASLGYTLSDIKNFSPVERLAVRWRLYNEIVHDQCKENDNYQLLIYEDLCRKPVEKAKQLFEFYGLSWAEETQAFVNQSVSKNKDTYYSVFKNPLEAAYKWKTKLDKNEIKEIVNILSGSTAFSWYESDFVDLI